MYREARKYLDSIAKSGSVLGLANIRELLERLNNPQADLKFIHIAGTNGKGSTLAFLSNILRESGYKTGSFSSPAVFEEREIIQINGVMISEENFVKLTFQIREAIEGMAKDGLTNPTIFEVETALAFLYFKQECCDFVVLETGLGGLLDATNVVNNTKVAVLTAISMDHMEYLGNTISEIARNKAGIIKKNASVVTTNQSLEAMEVIEETSKKLNNQLIFADKNQAEHIRFNEFQIVFDYKELKDMVINLAGVYQVQNAVLSIETALELNSQGFHIPKKAIRLGLEQTKWVGRFSKISDNPVIIVDGAHNEAAALELKETLLTYFNNKRLLFVMGVLKDKEYVKMSEIMAPLAQHIITVETPNNPRALDSVALMETIRRYNSNVESATTIEDAVGIIHETKSNYDAVIAFGSLSYLGELKRCVENR